MWCPGSTAVARHGETNDESDRAGRRVLIVDDHELLAETLALGLAARGLASRVADVGPTADVVEQARAYRPHLVLLDLDLLHADGLDLVERLRTGGADVLVVTGCTDRGRLAAALALGAAGVVCKSEPFEELLAASERALHRPSALAGNRHAELARLGREWLHRQRRLEARTAELSDREREVLAALADGRTARQIADEFVVSIGTVRTHIQSVLRKLDVSTQLAAVAAVAQLAPPKARALRRRR